MARGMTPAQISAARIELRSIIRDAWAIYATTGAARDEAIARQVEADCRNMLASLALVKVQKSPTHGDRANRRRKKKRGRFHRLNPGASILAQVRGLVQ